MSTYAEYFEDDDEGKQVKPFPEQWMQPTKFKAGQRVEYLRDNQYQGLVGVIVEVHEGYGPYPSEWQDDEGGGFWRTQHTAWLSVDFGPDVVFGWSWRDGKKHPDTRRAFHVCDEGEAFRVLTAASPSPKGEP